MCRLFGLKANKPVDLSFSLLDGQQTMSKLGESNPDGWGIGWYNESIPYIVKEPIPMSLSRSVNSISKETKSSIFICHVRKSTGTCKVFNNCHPFQYKNWLFAHNGSLEKYALFDRLTVNHKEYIKGDTDSETYFHWILQNIESCGNTIEGIRLAITEVLKNYISGLNFILTDGINLYAYRFAATNIDYYSLYYLDRKELGKTPFFAKSHEVNVILESKQLNNEKAILICSTDLTKEKWNEIPLGHILIVNQDLQIRIERVN